MPPKTKVARISMAHQDAKSQAGDQDVFDMIGKDLHGRILSFVLCLKDDKPGESYRGWNWQASKELAKSCRDFKCVSSSWCDVVRDFMNSQTPAELITSRDLALLKSRAMQLDLHSIGKNFIKDIKDQWGNHEVDLEDFEGYYSDENSALDLIVQHFGGSYGAFADLVAIEYRKFLIVKCVESLAAKKEEDETSELISMWKEKSVPSKLVDKFWHAHMLSPKKYAKDCAFLIGEIIDHDAGYVSAILVAGSDYESKKKFVFQFEAQFPTKDYFYGRLGNDGEEDAEVLLFGSDFNVSCLAACIWEDMEGENDCG